MATDSKADTVMTHWDFKWREDVLDLKGAPRGAYRTIAWTDGEDADVAALRRMEEAVCVVGEGWSMDFRDWPTVEVHIKGGPSSDASFFAFQWAFAIMYHRAAALDLDQALRTHVIIHSLDVSAAFRARGLVDVIKGNKANIRRCVKGTLVTASPTWFYLVAVIVGLLNGRTEAPYHTFKISADMSINKGRAKAWFDALPAHHASHAASMEDFESSFSSSESDSTEDGSE